MVSKKIRIQTFLSQAGVASRRSCDQMVSDQRVQINGSVAQIGQTVDVNDIVLLDGKRVVQGETQTKLFLLNKPVGYVCSTKDDDHAPSIFKLLPPIKKGRWCLVGRLDVQTSGLLLFTNSGSLANRLAHPKYKLKRQYLVRVFGDVTEHGLQKFKSGVNLDGKKVTCSIAQFHGKESRGMNKWILLELSVGLQHVVRRLCETQGWSVTRLKRVSFGHLKLPKELNSGLSIELDLKRFLTKHKIDF